MNNRMNVRKEPILAGTKGKVKAGDALAKIIAAAKQQGMRDHLVKVRMKRYNDGVGDGMRMEVEVFSTMKPGSAFQVVRDVYQNESISELERIAGTSAAAGAEACCERFGDNYDPAKFEAGGIDAFKQILEAMNAGVLTTGNTRV